MANQTQIQQFDTANTGFQILWRTEEDNLGCIFYPSFPEGISVILETIPHETVKRGASPSNTVLICAMSTKSARTATEATVSSPNWYLDLDNLESSYRSFVESIKKEKESTSEDPKDPRSNRNHPEKSALDTNEMYAARSLVEFGTVLHQEILQGKDGLFPNILHYLASLHGTLKLPNAKSPNILPSSDLLTEHTPLTEVDQGTQEESQTAIQTKPQWNAKLAAQKRGWTMTHPSHPLVSIFVPVPDESGSYMFETACDTNDKEIDETLNVHSCRINPDQLKESMDAYIALLRDFRMTKTITNRKPRKGWNTVQDEEFGRRRKAQRTMVTMINKFGLDLENDKDDVCTELQRTMVSVIFSDFPRKSGSHEDKKD